MTDTPQIVIVTDEDSWHAIYVNGEKVYEDEDHPINPGTDALLKALGAYNIKERSIDLDYFSEELNAEYPDKLSDIPDDKLY